MTSSDDKSEISVSNTGLHLSRFLKKKSFDIEFRNVSKMRQSLPLRVDHLFRKCVWTKCSHDKMSNKMTICEELTSAAQHGHLSEVTGGSFQWCLADFYRDVHP